MKIELKGISKAYQQKDVLENINLNIDGGEIFSLIGKNGVGKSTLLEILVGLTEADNGEILLNGNIIFERKDEWKRKIGAALNIDHLIETLNIEEYLILLSNIYGIDKNTVKNRIKYLKSFFFQNEDNIYKPIKFYSSGMKRKALLCAAFIHKPDILLLDEPFTFLDPAACSNLCEFLMHQKEEGKIVFLSSHDLLYVDKITTHIGVLDDKKLIFNDNYTKFKEDNDFFKENKLLKKVLNYKEEDHELYKIAFN